jgi:hypothetical protein
MEFGLVWSVLFQLAGFIAVPLSLKCNPDVSFFSSKMVPSASLRNRGNVNMLYVAQH